MKTNWMLERRARTKDAVSSAAKATSISGDSLATYNRQRSKLRQHIRGTVVASFN